jgi:hypothetical protein
VIWEPHPGSTLAGVVKRDVIELSKNCQRFVASVMVALPFQNRQDEDQALEGIQ